MRIGIDAKWYFNGPPSGRRVIRSLVGSLVDVARPDDELHFFLDRRSRADTPTGVAAARCHHVWSVVNQLSNMLAVPRAADDLKMDVVVYQNFAPPRAFARHARVAFVHDVIFAERPEFFTRAEQLYFAPLRALSTRADRVCTVSESEKTRLVRLGFAVAGDVDVVPNAVDDVFAPRDSLTPEHIASVLGAMGVREPFVLYVGRLTARKNVGALVRAMAHLASKECTLVLAGPADRTCPDLISIAREVGVEPRIRFLGLRGDADLRVLYAAASVFVFPSFDESFGFPPLEAMAAGTPVVASRVPALVETCGDAAAYADPHDPRDIARAIDEVVGAPANGAARREAGFRQARTFSWRDSANRLLTSARRAAAELA